MDTDRKINVGISQGDINGISYEVIIKALSDPRMIEMFTPVVYGLSKAASYHKKTLDLDEFNFNILKSAEKPASNAPNLVNIHNQEVKIDLGQPSRQSGEMAFLALEAAVQDLKKGYIDVLVTAPINKKSIQSSDFEFPGHTEYLAQRFNSKDYLMLMIGDTLKIGAITGHIPLRDVSQALSIELIVNKARILEQSLVMDFGIQKPRVALLGLNPHGSDDGLIGDEESKLILPAIEKLTNEGLLVYGPFPSDGFFGNHTYEHFDAVLAMYHDQAMLPFKILMFDSGVNFTAGLPFVRTSPAHGTAFDIAGKNMASEDSFRKAIYWAIDIYKNREIFKEISRDPLKPVIQEEGDNYYEKNIVE